MRSRSVKITFITKPGCHLCEEARPVVLRVLEEQRSAGIDVQLEELNMLDDEKLTKKFSEDIPVVLVNGKRHSFWHVDEQKLAGVIQKKGR